MRGGKRGTRGTDTEGGREPQIRAGLGTTGEEEEEDGDGRGGGASAGQERKRTGPRGSEMRAEMMRAA